jgi:hypothetical protein
VLRTRPSNCASSAAASISANRCARHNRQFTTVPPRAKVAVGVRRRSDTPIDRQPPNMRTSPPRHRLSFNALSAPASNSETALSPRTPGHFRQGPGVIRQCPSVQAEFLDVCPGAPCERTRACGIGSGACPNYDCSSIADLHNLRRNGRSGAY